MKQKAPENGLPLSEKKVDHNTRGIGGRTLSLSRSPPPFHFPIGVHSPNLSLVAPEDPQTRAAVFHAPNPDGGVGAAGYDQGQEELDAVNVVLVSQESDKRLRVRVVVGRRLVQVPNVWREGVPDFIKVTTVIGARMSHWKLRETKQHPSRARSGHKISCSLVSLNFRCRSR